jgi:hypothetical protein
MNTKNTELATAELVAAYAVAADEYVASRIDAFKAWDAVRSGAISAAYNLAILTERAGTTAFEKASDVALRGILNKAHADFTAAYAAADAARDAAYVAANAAYVAAVSV